MIELLTQYVEPSLKLLNNLLTFASRDFQQMLCLTKTNIMSYQVLPNPYVLTTTIVDFCMTYWLQKVT